MTRGTQRVRAARLTVLLAAVIGLCPLLVQALPAFAEDSDGGTVTVEVTEDVPTPSPSPQPPTPPGPPGPSGPGSPGAQPATPGVPAGPTQPGSPGPAPGTADQTTIEDPDAADAALGETVETSGGLLYLSGVHGEITHSLLPSGGDVLVSVTVRNISSQAIDGSLELWITTLWGWRMSELAGIEVTALNPGETRTITARLSGPGQWAFHEAHATFTPPETIDGVETPPLTRESFLFVPPYFALAIALALLLAGILYRIWSRRAAERAEADAAFAVAADTGVQ